MTGTVPPRLLGPRMAVWASFPFDNRLLTPAGVSPPVRADWTWAMAQWDRVARAGRVVRLVVVDQAYSLIDLATADGPGRRDQVQAKFDACRAGEQLIFGRVYVGGGKVPLGQVGDRFDDPLRPGHQVPGVLGQIDAWRAHYGHGIDGIYVDSGPTDCTDPSIPGADTTIPGNYASYVAAIQVLGLGYRVFVQAAQYPDNQPNSPWLRRLGADFLQLWEGGISPYTVKFQAVDACHPDRPGAVPAWWDPGPASRWSRVHVINDCRNVDAMRTVANVAVNARGAATIWITLPRQDASLGAVYDVLPPYWDDEVAFFDVYRQRDDDAAKDAQDTKDAQDQAAQEQKDTKDASDKTDKDNKDDKDTPDDAAKNDKDTKDNKDDKDIPDKPKEDSEEIPLTDKQIKDSKDFKDDGDKTHDKPVEILKDSEAPFKTLETAGLADPAAGTEAGYGAASPGEDPAQGRTFIRGEERPAVGERIVADPPEPADGED
jgi:hypothetical protein